MGQIPIAPHGMSKTSLTYPDSDAKSKLIALNRARSFVDSSGEDIVEQRSYSERDRTTPKLWSTSLNSASTLMLGR
jgi:hypothetical protein